MAEHFSPISKTSFLKFDQCPKAFFLYKKFNHLKDPVSKEKQLTFNRGHAVGFAAQQLFPGGIDVSKETSNMREATALTAELVAKKQPVIYEATFVFNTVLVMVDILRLGESGWEAYEVKSSLKINDTYIKDACLQYYVLKNVLPGLDDFFLVNMNGDYVLAEHLNYKELFKKRSIKKDGEKNLGFFHDQVDKMSLVLERNSIPDIAIGKHCFSPYPCDFMGACWKGLDSEKSVFNIGKINKEQLFNWYGKGITTVDKITPGEDLEEDTRIQVQSIQQQKEYINVKAVKLFLSGIKSKHCFLDMEIWSPAIPFYKGTSPFEQIPFLFSLCYEVNSEPVFSGYLKPIEYDAREEFMWELIKATQRFDQVIVFDKNLEIHIIEQLIVLFPQLKKVGQALKSKIVDISGIVNHFQYYHPKFKGNFSLKAVSELFGTSEYSKQDISSGLIAMNAYQSLLHEENPIIAETVKQQLIDYCNLDTLTCLNFFNYLGDKTRMER
jgi:hypothetical protein